MLETLSESGKDSFPEKRRLEIFPKSNGELRQIRPEWMTGSHTSDCRMGQAV
jgi:hypothetical protein